MLFTMLRDLSSSLISSSTNILELWTGASVSILISGFQKAEVTKRAMLLIILGGKYTFVRIYYVYFNWAEFYHVTHVIFAFDKYFEFECCNSILWPIKM